MRILLITQVVPNPPDSGPKVKTHYLLRYLAQRHDVHLVSFVRSAEEVSAAHALEQWCRSVTTVPLRRSRRRDLRFLARSVLTNRPFLVLRDDLPEMHRAIAELVHRHAFDAVHADQLTMGQYALDVSVPLRVLDEHNAVWTIVRQTARRERLLPLRLLAEREWRSLHAYEGQLCRQMDHVTVVSKEDRNGLEAAAGATFASTIIPIAVDVDALAFTPRQRGARQILSVATMYYPPNAEGVSWFARNVFPLVRARVPGVTFAIVGSRPPSAIRRLGAPGRGIVVTGYVENLDPIVERSGVLIVPVHSGSGIRVKILEAFARGIPVVSTGIGAEGIDVRDGEHLLIADSPQAFAAAVTALLLDTERANRLAMAARALVETRYDWRTALTPLDDLYPVTDPAAVPGVG